MTKRTLHNLTLTKIAAVDFPCQEPAQALIIKRAADAYDQLLKAKYSADDRKAMAGKAAMADGSFPVADEEDLHNAIRAVGRGRNNSHAAIRRHVEARAKALGLSDQIPDTWGDGGKLGKAICDAIRKSGFGLSDPDGDEGAQDFDAVLGEQALTQQFWDDFYKASNALQLSLTSILKDEAVTDKGPMITQSLQEFADYIEGMVPGDIGKALAAGIAAMFTGPAGPTVQGDNTMSDAIKKALGLPATATEAEVLKAMEEKDKKLKETEKECNVAKMSDKHKAFAANPDAKMPAGGKDKFAEMTAAERDAHMSAHPVDDEDTEVEKALKAGNAFKTAEGSIVLKRKVGEDVFAVMKALNAKSIAQETELAKAREDKIAKEFEDLATENGFAKGFAPTLRKALAGADPEARAALLKEFKAARAQADAGGVFKEFGGHGGPNAGSAEAEVLAKRDQLMAADPKLSAEQAYARVWKDKGNAELRKRYTAEKGGN